MSSLIRKSIPHAVTLDDGTVETVQVATRLSITGLYSLIDHAAADRSPQIVALCTGKPLDWIDALPPKEFAVLAGKCMTLNFTDALALMDDPVAGARLAPLLSRLDTAMKLGGAMSSGSSSAPAPSASAAEISKPSATASTLSDSTPSSPPA